MQQGLSTFSLKNFQGVRNWENEQNIPPNYLFYAQNAEIEGGRFRSSKGITQYLSPLAGGTRIRSLLYYPYQVGSVTTDYILEYYQSQWYVINTNNDTRSLVGGPWLVDEDAGGVIYNNQAYVVSPTNGMAWYDYGTGWSTTFVGTPPSGSMMDVNAEKIWTAGVPNFPSVLYYSRTANAAAPSNIRDWTTGSGSVLIGKGGSITGLKNLKSTLYVFKNDSIYYLKGFDTSGTYPVPLFDPYSVTSGAVNQNCVCQVENDLWFLTPSREIRSLGSAENFLSDPRTFDVSLAVKRYIYQLDPDQSGATMSYFNKVLKISMKTIGSPINNWTLVYDMNDNTFEIERLAANKLYVNTPTQRFFAEDGTSGTLYKDSVGYSKSGTSFDWNGQTVMIDLRRPGLQKRLRYLEVYLGRSINQTVYVKIYKDTYSSIPTVYTLWAPTVSETGSTSPLNTGAWGTDVIGGGVWGGGGLSVSTSDEPTLYRRIFKIDVSQTAKMFGVELQATINGGLVEVEQIDFHYIILPEKNKYVDI